MAGGESADLGARRLASAGRRRRCEPRGMVGGRGDCHAPPATSQCCGRGPGRSRRGHSRHRGTVATVSAGPDLSACPSARAPMRCAMLVTFYGPDGTPLLERPQEDMPREGMLVQIEGRDGQRHTYRLTQVLELVVVTGLDYYSL